MAISDLATKVGPPTLDELRRRRHEVLRIAAAHGAHSLQVFGSVARGTARPDSDVDLLVEFEPGRSVLDLCGLIADLEDTLGRTVDVIELRRPSHAADYIRREAVPL